MATLKDVADLARVPMLVAFAALKNDASVDGDVRQSVMDSAQQLKYRLRITQVDVADLAGVAKATVSYALNDSELISEATRQKVWQAAEALHYRPNTIARSLRKNRAGAVGYSWHIADDPSTMNNLLDRFIYRVTISAEQAGFHLLTFIQPQKNAEKVYDELISTNRVDGFIISDVRYDDSRIARLQKIAAPFVAFGGMYSEDTDFAYVDVDGKHGIRLAVEHLLEIGHRRIGLVGYEPGRMVGDAREASYRETMEAAGLAVESDWVVHTPNIFRLASKATERLLAAKRPPTAIICANDVMAFGAKTYFDSIGLVPGRDIALTGYDDDPTSEFLGITSVRQPIDEVAAGVFSILFGEINGNPCAERQVVLLPELIVRRSTSG